MDPSTLIMLGVGLAVAMAMGIIGDGRMKFSTAIVFAAVVMYLSTSGFINLSEFGLSTATSPETEVVVEEVHIEETTDTTTISSSGDDSGLSFQFWMFIFGLLVILVGVGYYLREPLLRILKGEKDKSGTTGDKVYMKSEAERRTTLLIKPSKRIKRKRKKKR